MTNYLILIASFASFASLGAACGSEAGDSAADGGAGAGTALLRYTDVVLPDLGADFVYEGWLIVDDAPVAAGRFSVDGAGVLTPATLSVDADDAERASLFVLTVEPAVGDDPAPAKTHMLAGAMSQGAASLVTSHPGALGTDFATAAGRYILATPTTGDDTRAEQGIWWLAPTEPMAASLDLPVLPDGWAYEGWIVGADGPVSTGRFVDPAGADSDGAGSTKGPVGDGPAFPGQDFIMPATVLNGGSTVAVISVEPEPDNHPGPFLIKPLVSDPIGSAVAPAEHTMSNNAAATLPSATVSFVLE